jgi:hypothetical protein
MLVFKAIIHSAGDGQHTWHVHTGGTPHLKFILFNRFSTKNTLR